ncbi:MAG: hypothetical protein GY859_27050, partial [Desulfobacterales bacterium]|nr:hypothetical protein [Desulfobacterales bacterium]
YTDATGSPGVSVFKPTPDLCDGIPDVDGYDVGPVTGKLAIVDYETGCTGHMGLYTADKDGADLQLLADFKSAPWGGAHDVFWSPDESRLALTVSYNFYYGVIVMDANGESIPGEMWSNESGVNFINLRLHGWSPDGEWLLYSIWPGQAAEASLYKARVNTDGSLDLASITALLTDQPISGAAWVSITAPSTPAAPVLTIAPGGQNVDFKWTRTPAAEGYFFYYAPYPDAGPVNSIDVGNMTGASLPLPPGVSFYVAILPYNAAGAAFGFSNIALLNY